MGGPDSFEDVDAKGGAAGSGGRTSTGTGFARSSLSFGGTPFMPYCGSSTPHSQAAGPPSVNTLNDRFLHRPKRTHFSDPIPCVRGSRRASNGFIALQEPRHEEFFRQSRQFYPAPFA